MGIDNINIGFNNTLNLNKANTVDINKGTNFSNYLNKALETVNDSQVNAENATQSLITGETTDLHQVMLATEEARLMLELAVQIRNKVVDAYQEISRMQI